MFKSINWTKLAKIAIFVLMFGSFVLPAFAQVAESDPFGLNAVAPNTGLGGADLRGTIGNLIKVALTFLGVVALIIVLIGGFKYMTSGGSDEKMADARKYIMAGIVGLAIILLSYAITSFVFESLITATSTEGGTSLD